MKNNNLKPQTTNHKLAQGFTLVELAIVLVIIGLLTAGVVGGQSLIESSKINKSITQLKSIETAMRAFELEYDAKPGDFKDASIYWSGAYNGNGNKYIGDTTNSYPYYLPEQKAFFQHLSLSGILPFSFSGDFTIVTTGVRFNQGSTINSPYENVGYGFGTMSYGAARVQGLTMSYLDNNEVTDHGFLYVKPVMTIDKKIDDGQPGMGKINGLNQSWQATGCVDMAINSAASNANVVAYTPTNTSYTGCILSYRLDR